MKKLYELSEFNKHGELSYKPFVAKESHLLKSLEEAEKNGSKVRENYIGDVTIRDKSGCETHYKILSNG